MKQLNQEAPIPYTTRTKLQRMNLLESVPLSGPLTVHIEPTNICNFKCTFCPESFSNYKEKAEVYSNYLWKISSILLKN